MVSNRLVNQFNRDGFAGENEDHRWFCPKGPMVLMKTTGGLVSGHIYVLPETYISFGKNIYMSQEAAADWEQKKGWLQPM